MTNPFGDLLKEWRSIRRFSQLQLSLEADISSRHLSFLESGRAKPSRTMVVKLGDALQMPKETINMAMQAAGFTPTFPNLSMDDEALAPVYAAVSQMISAHDPMPAVAIDRHWDVVNANVGAMNLFVILGLQGAGNMLDAIVALADTDLVENWEETAFLALARLRSEIVQLGGDRILEKYAAQIANHPRLAAMGADAINFNQAVIPTIFNISGKRLSLFSTIASFGAVQDVVVSDIRIELMFALDEETKDFFVHQIN